MIENVVTSILREAGIKLGTPSRAAFADRVRELTGAGTVIMALVEPLLAIHSHDAARVRATGKIRSSISPARSKSVGD